MEQVVIAAALSNVSIALVKTLIQKGMSFYLVTDSIEGWKQQAPEIFVPQNTITDNFALTFTPSYLIFFTDDFPGPIAINGKKIVTIINDNNEKRTIENAVDEILRGLFSFGGNVSVSVNTQPIQLPKKDLPSPVQVVEIPKHPQEDLPLFLKREEHVPTNSRVEKENKPKIKKSRKWTWIVGIIIFLIIIPFTILGIATALTLVGVKLVTLGELKLARQAFAASSQMSSISSVVPASSQASYILQRITKTGEEGTYVVEDINKIIEGVFGTEHYPLSELSQNLQHKFQVIHRELSFLETELQQENNLVSKYFPMEQLSQMRKAALAGEDISSRLPAVLGVDEEKSYMVLLQNNKELRPTGGFIGSFAILHFSGGRLIDAPVYDVYSADGQLKGYVEPPKAIKDYLGEASWYLRDSNWDPDFPTSAERAEWFLDKTMGTDIDGVIAIDLEFVRQLIAEQGVLEIPDFNMNLTKDNFYELIQNEVHKDFFPGSRKKAAVLTATMNTLLNNLLQQVKNRNISLAAVTANALAGRHIQIKLEDPVLQNQVQVLGWAGEAIPSSCGDKCEQIWLGMVEANVGVNKANYFIEREAELKSVWLNGQWEHELTITLINTARGDGVVGEHDYETYLRVMAPVDANFDRVIMQTAKGRSSSQPEIEKMEQRVEAGTLVVIPAGETRVVTFLWSDNSNITLTENDKIQLYWRKQAGIESHPIKVKITLPQSSLTEQHEFEYNSNLETDFSQIIEL